MEANNPTASTQNFSVVSRLINDKLKEITSLDLLEEFQNDPTNPLHSKVKSFKELPIPEWLLQGLYAMNFSKPSRIQEIALPLLFDAEPKNMIAQSQSGTGKTAAFVLASLYRVNVELQYPQVLVICPTYELALQTSDVCRQMVKYGTVKIRNAVRGERLERGTRITEHVLVGTPGKMIDWAFKFRAFDVTKLKVFVLDEADVMIDQQGLRTQSIQMRSKLSPDCLLLLFSATYAPDVLSFAQEIVTQPFYLLALRQEDQSLDNIKQYYIEVRDENEKFEALRSLYDTVTIGQTFIFVESRASAHRLAGRLRDDGHSVGLISGDLTVEERNDVITRFRSGQERVIIATNVLARGIDVPQVTLVVNYDLPLKMDGEVDFETYLHRIGRTGRFGKEGIAINFAENEGTLDKINIIEKYFGKAIQKLDYTNFDDVEKIGPKIF